MQVRGALRSICTHTKCNHFRISNAEGLKPNFLLLASISITSLANIRYIGTYSSEHIGILAKVHNNRTKKNFVDGQFGPITKIYIIVTLSHIYKIFREKNKDDDHDCDDALMTLTTIYLMMAIVLYQV